MTTLSSPNRIQRLAPLLPCCALLVLTLSTVAAVAFAPAAGQTARAPDKPAAQPIITIKKADGSTLRAQLVEADGRRLTVKPAEGKAFGEAVEVAWADVKTVSNGLTQRKAHDAWALAHKDELCEACHGERFLPCDTCKGTSHDPAARKDCKTCKGELLVDCTEKRCDEGKVPCPSPCLKLTEGSWSKPDKDGKRWRSFRVKGGTQLISDGHVGEIVKVENGVFQAGVACETCGKTGKVTCPTCHGRAKAACPACKADKTAADCASCDDGTQACATCAGSGLKGSGTAPAPLATPEQPAAPPQPAAPAPAAAPAPPAAPQPVETKPAGNSGDGLD